MNHTNKALVIAVFTVFAASAQVYKYIDKDGKVQYTDQPPADAKKSEVKVDPPAEVGKGATKDTWRGQEKDLDKRPIEKRRLRDACVKAKEDLRQLGQALDQDRKTKLYVDGRRITPELVEERR